MYATGTIQDPHFTVTTKAPHSVAVWPDPQEQDAQDEREEARRPRLRHGELRGGRGPRRVLAAQVLQGLGLGLFIWAWFG